MAAETLHSAPAARRPGTGTGSPSHAFQLRLTPTVIKLLRSKALPVTCSSRAERSGLAKASVAAAEQRRKLCVRC